MRLVKTKKVVLGILSMGMCMNAGTVWAKTGTQNVSVTYNNTKVYLEGTPVTTTAEPFTLGGKTYVAIEDLAKALSLKVEKGANNSAVSLVPYTIMGQVGVTKEKESNNAYSEANYINLNSTVTGSLGSTDDNGSRDKADYYKIVLQQDGYLKLSLEASVGAYVQLDLYGENGSTNRGWDNGRDKVLGVNQYLQAGTYYVRVQQSSGTGNYSLTNSFAVQGMTKDLEPNGSYQNAIVHKLGATATGHIGYEHSGGGADEYDWYKVSVPTTREINVILDGTANLSAGIDLYASNASTNLGWDNGKNEQLRITKKVDAGVYYVRVRRVSNAGGYTLIIK